jgi:ribosome biogenesis GTPase A
LCARYLKSHHHRFVGGNPIILVGNKADILPKSVKRERLVQWMKREAKEYPASVKIKNINDFDNKRVSIADCVQDI